MHTSLVAHPLEVNTVLAHDTLIIGEPPTEHEIILDVGPCEAPGEIATTAGLDRIETDIILETEVRDDGCDVVEHDLSDAKNPKQCQHP